MKNKSTLIIILFLGAQIIVDLMGSVTAFPFLHYGMYSEVFDSKKTSGAYHVEVNGKALNANDYSISEWEMIIAPLSLRLQYLQSKDFNNDKVLLSRFTSEIEFDALSDANHLNNPHQHESDFKSYYNNHLYKLISKPINELSAQYIQYQFQREQYLPIDTIPIISP